MDWSSQLFRFYTKRNFFYFWDFFLVQRRSESNNVSDCCRVCVCPLFRVNHQESSALFFALSPSASSFHRRGSYCIAGIQCLKTKHNFLSTFTTMDGCILFSNNIVILWASTRWERGLLFLDSQEPNDMDLSFRLPTLCSPSCLLPGRAIFPPKSLQMVIIYRHHHYLSSYIFSKPRPSLSQPTIFRGISFVIIAIADGRSRRRHLSGVAFNQPHS
jgi:hypothetical protein